jgi:phenylalanyl-tRNA synthetase beta chain
MIASHEWMKAFVPHALPAAEVGRLLGAHVATLDGAEALRADLAPFVVARVVESERVPDTKLSANKVDDGSGALRDVVCGAPNVTVGALYPFARTGTTMPGGQLTIERRRIRGFTSDGMLCSARELGLGAEHDGILELHTAAPPGTPLLDVLPAGDVRLDFDVLANRPDLLSQRGMARELAALTGVPMRNPPELAEAAPLPAPAAGTREALGGGVTVRIEDPADCPRYCAAVIRGVRVGPSPAWLVERLAGVGARSVNNVVDATNYALHGLGQPMHAFDLDRLGGATVVVRRAHAGERLTTLDGGDRALDPDTLVIADAVRPHAVAGVMGGRDSEVTDATTDVLLEVAYFDPRRVRASRKRAGVSSDASYRFERGVDRAATLELLAFGAALVTGVAGGGVEAVLDVGGAPGVLPPVSLRAARLARVLGHVVPDAEVERLLAAVGFTLTPRREPPGDGTTWSVAVPSWRHDVVGEVDLIEEVARLVGFDALPDDLRPFRPGTVPDHPLVNSTRRVREALVAAGLLESRPLPFVRGDDATHPRVANPLADDEPHLRTSALDTLARRAEYNLTRMQGDVRLFEVGSVFRAAEGDGLPEERLVGAVLVMGQRRPPHFTEPRPPAFDVWDAKGLGELLAGAAFPGADVALTPGAPDGPAWTVRVDGRAVGEVREVALDAPVWASPAFGVEITLGVLDSAHVAAAGANVWKEAVAAQAGVPEVPHVRFRPLPTTPAVDLDLALVVPDAVAAAEVERVLRAFGGDTLEQVTVFDEFRGGDVPAGSRSLAWRVVLRDPARTLRDKEIAGRRQKLLQALERELGVRPRAG